MVINMRKIQKLTVTILLTSVLLTALIVRYYPSACAKAPDLRSYAHGISYIENPQTHQSYLIWSDAYKKGIKKDGSWTHDVYRM